jgi:DNA-binding response OmpR family regulator
MAGEKILVVDDERNIVKIIRAYLERDGYRVLTASDGRQAIDTARREKPSLVVLDLMLPEVSGWDVCRTLRQESQVPVIMVTARDEVTDRIVGLELGADDYVTKPFDPKELVARVHAVLRRSSSVQTSDNTGRLIAGPLEVDTSRHEVLLGGRPVQLTPTEFDLLVVMAGSPGRVFPRLELLERVQGEAFDGYEGYERVVDSHIKNLRQKIETDPRQPQMVLTVFGVGYKFADQPLSSARRLGKPQNPHA